MSYTRNVETGKFVAWGKNKAKENSYIVKEGELLEGKVVSVKDSEKYFKIFEIQPKGEDEVVIVTATKRIRDEFGYAAEKDSKNNWTPIPLDKQKAKTQVKAGDKVRIHFEGMKKTKSGQMYDLWTEVDSQ